MIPKRIHFCWFGRGEKPDLAKRCIAGWKKHLPEYELVEWNEDNFDLNSSAFCREAYDAKKYAFVSDYVRLEALHKQGGVYMDADVEILKTLDCFLHHSAFSGFEQQRIVPTGLMAAEKGNLWIKELLDYYKDKHFDPENMVANTVIITKSCLAAGLNPNGQYQELKNGVVFYPYTYFCAKSYETGKISVTSDTVAIHHFAGSWEKDENLRKKERQHKLCKICGAKIGTGIIRFMELASVARGKGARGTARAILRRFGNMMKLGKV